MTCGCGWSVTSNKLETQAYSQFSAAVDSVGGVGCKYEEAGPGDEKLRADEMLINVPTPLLPRHKISPFLPPLRTATPLYSPSWLQISTRMR